MIKYNWIDLFWLGGLLVANRYFINTQATDGQFFVLNFIALITMFGVGILNYSLNEYEKKKKK